jgi:hypothetical protein
LHYTAAKLHEKGVLLEVDGLPTTQFRNVQFEITPADHNGIFIISGKFMGVQLEKVEIDIQVRQNTDHSFSTLLTESVTPEVTLLTTRLPTSEKSRKRGSIQSV